MHSKAALYLNDTQIRLFHQGKEKLSLPLLPYEKAKTKLFSYLPSSSLSLIIEGSFVSFHEEVLPSLSPWDTAQLFFHRRALLSRHKGFTGLHFFKSHKTWILRWILLEEDSPLFPWVKLALQTQGNIFFTSLEAGCYLRTQERFSHKTLFQILKCPHPETGEYNYIYKGRRFILFRNLKDHNDLPSVLHFLGRTFPEIQENYTISTVNFPDFIDFILSQKRPTFRLKKSPSPSKIRWLPYIGIAMLAFFAVKEAYEAFYLQKQTKRLKQHIVRLETECHGLRTSLASPRGHTSYHSLENYLFFKKRGRKPLHDLQKLSLLLHKYSLHLENIEWQVGPQREIVFKFFLPLLSSHEKVESLFQNFLNSLQETFQDGHISLISVPYNSSPHTTFKHTELNTPPSATLKIILP